MVHRIGFVPDLFKKVIVRRDVALQLPICFEVRALSGSLVSSAPE